MNSTFKFKILALSLAALPLALGAEFSPVLQGSLRGGYAATVGGKGAFLGLGDIYLVPAWRSGRLSYLPIMSGSSGAQERSIEEGTTFVRNLSLNFRPTIKLDLDTHKVGGRLQALRNWNMETVDEVLGTGLYDYEQFGGGFGYERPFPASEAALLVWIDLAHRSYPNYRNFGAAAALSNGKNYYIKDFDALSGDLAWELKGYIEGRAYYRVEWRRFSDALVVKNDGQLDSSALRQDWLHTAGFSRNWLLGPGLDLWVGLDLTANFSNQGYFDNFAPVPTYVANFQDFVSETFSLRLPMRRTAFLPRLTVQPGYALALVQSQKPVQESAGAHSKDKVFSTDHSLSLRLEHPGPWGLNWALDSAYRMSRSNQQYVRGLQNNYDYWQISLGLSYLYKGR